MPCKDHEGIIVVVKGNHVVPKGVAVEELDGDKKKLSEECPEALKELLDANGLMAVYDKMVQAIVEESNTRNFFGKWKDQEFISILDLFKEDFGAKGVKVALCKRRSGSGIIRWLEFIDVDEQPTYVPQFDVANFSGQVIKTCYTRLEFPYGVAVEEFKQYGKSRKRLKEKSPIFVQKLIEEKDLQAEYDELVDDCVTNGCGKYKNWSLEKLNEFGKTHRVKFEAKGVCLFISQKEEYISHGQYGGHVEYFRWVEFVDREEQPNYYPQRDAERSTFSVLDSLGDTGISLVF
jgi:hypothetical protein